MRHSSILAVGLLVWAIACPVCFCSDDRGPDLNLSDPAEPWRDANIGAEPDHVPPPFEPLKLEGQTVSCWGRSIRMTGLFPAALSSAGKEILVAPITVSMHPVQGETVVLNPGEGEFGLVRKDRIEWTGQGQAGPVAWRSACWVEYDGMMQIALTLRADNPVAIAGLQIDIPVTPGFALYHTHTAWGGFANDEIGAGTGQKLSSPWKPYWWLGDDYRGLTFLTETQAGWRGNDQAIQFIREDDRLIFRANIWSDRTDFVGEQTFVFGLHPTPAKPLPYTWHGRHVGSVLPGVTIGTTWLQSTAHFSYPQEDERKLIGKAVEKNRKLGVQTVMYVAPTGQDARTGVFQRNYAEWIIAKADGTVLLQDRNIEGSPYQFDSTCVASSVTDWMAWALDRAMAVYDIDGIFVDNALVLPCHNKLHGCDRDGMPSYPYFGSREWHKRMYTVIRRHKPKNGLVWEHATRYNISPALSFVDIYSDGEQFRDTRSDPYAISLDHITDAFMRIGFTGRQFGAQPAFMASALCGRVGYTDWLLARTLPFGNVLWLHASWYDETRLMPVLRVRHRFGLGSQKVEWFTPVDDRPDWLNVGPVHLLVGAYVRPDGDVLLTLGNPGDEACSAGISRTSLNKKFPTGFKVYDALADQEYNYHDSGVMIPANSFRVLWIGNNYRSGHKDKSLGMSGVD